MTGYTFKLSLACIMGAALLTACKTLPEPEAEVVQKPVDVTPVQTCLAPTTLTREVIPAVYKRGFHITSIENPPEYYTDPETGEVREIINPPIENKVAFETLIEPEQIIWRDVDGNAVTDVCLPEGETLESYIPG